MIRIRLPGAIKASYSVVTRLVGQCSNAVSSLGSMLNVILLWVAGYEDLEGNGWIDGQTRQGSDREISVLLVTLKHRIYPHYLAAAEFR